MRKCRSCCLRAKPGRMKFPAVEAQALLQRTEVQLHANINPGYISNLRAVVSPDGQKRIVAIVLASITVKAGDQVVYSGAYRDQSLPCHYMPNLISSVQDGAAVAGDTPRQ